MEVGRQIRGYGLARGGTGGARATVGLGAGPMPISRQSPLTVVREAWAGVFSPRPVTNCRRTDQLWERHDGLGSCGGGQLPYIYPDSASHG